MFLKFTDVIMLVFIFTWHFLFKYLDTFAI